MFEHSVRTALFISISMVIGPGAIAADAETKPASRQLAVEESVKVKVESKAKFNASGVKVKAGEHYAFVVADGAKWKDLTIVCDANGWLSKDGAPAFRNFLQKAEKDRRVPAANWFELVGTIGENEKHHFQIGLRGAEWTHTTKTDGELFLFANDLMRMYGNNHDSIEVTVTRKEKPGKNQLPVNPAKP
jgi:hypothetical protein